MNIDYEYDYENQDDNDNTHDIAVENIGETYDYKKWFN